jgi:hypothetical protein
VRRGGGDAGYPAFAATGGALPVAAAAGRRLGSATPAIVAARARAAQTPIAGANPSLNARAEA